MEGIITDDPALYGRVCGAWERERKGGGVVEGEAELVVDGVSVGQRVQIWMVAVFVLLFGWVIKRRYLMPVERVRIEERKVT